MIKFVCNIYWTPRWILDLIKIWISPKLKNFLPIILIEIELVVDNLSSRDVGGVGCGGTEIMNPINN